MGGVLGWLGVGGLLGPAIIVSVYRQVQPTTDATPLIVAFTPYALVAYALAAGLLVVLSRLGARRTVRTLFMVSVAGIAAHLWWMSPTLSGDLPAYRAEEELTVMTVNLDAGSADVAEVARLVDRQEVDVLVLQEATPAAIEALREEDIASAMPYQAGASAPRQQGTVVLSRFPLRGNEGLEMPQGAWRTIVTAYGREIALYAVHPTSPSVDAPAWRRDYDRLLSSVDEDETDALIVGDLNASLDHAPVQDLQAAGFRDAAEQVNGGWSATQRVGLLGVDLPFVAADHVLSRGSWVAVETSSFDVDDSDNGALVARLAPGGDVAEAAGGR